MFPKPVDERRMFKNVRYRGANPADPQRRPLKSDAIASG
ncbi:MAG: hypothetical protein [Olavius algarvensis Delta 4 endosymbiont]|nr:MAG: hypothetical protein [Olavius algarvensis Delta 4 endosymbiont]